MFAVWSQSSCRIPRRVCTMGVISAVSLIMGLPAAAQTACVRCTGPEATYICTATSDEPFRDKAVGLFCASKIAADRQHNSCAASRAGDPCTEGVSVSFAYDGGGEGSMLPPTSPPPGPVEQRAEKQPDKQPGKNGEPETLVDLTKDTVDGSVDAVKKAGKATGDALKDTGRAIGDATKKTLKCLGSALNDC
jgi:hypothetical protein